MPELWSSGCTTPAKTEGPGRRVITVGQLEQIVRLLTEGQQEASASEPEVNMASIYCLNATLSYSDCWILDTVVTNHMHYHSYWLVVLE